MSLLAIAIVAAVSPPGPTLAVEDTLHTEVPPVIVRAPRVTLEEILARVARGEARRTSLIEDQTFLATARVVAHAAETARPPEVYSETVFRVYRKRPGKSRTDVLRRYQAHPPKKGPKGSVEVQFGPGMGEEIVNFAFRPEARRDFRYRIVGRDIHGNHVVYRVAFEPRSLLTMPGNPTGLVWIDTNEFVIVRQEVHFERSPVPLLLDRVDRMVIERGQVDGLWVLRRVLVRATAILPLPKLGRSFDFSIQFDDYASNTGLADTLFTGRSARAAREDDQ